MSSWRSRNSSARVVGAPLSFIEPCLPSVVTKAPSGPLWIHEIKHDGYRLQVQRRGTVVRLLTRRGADWTARFPWIVESAMALKADAFTIDGEAVVCDAGGLAVFDLLHGKGNDARAMLYAFDVMSIDGEDIRTKPLLERKAALAGLVRTRRKQFGIRLSEHIEGEGPTIFAHACKLGLEGIVSKRADARYRSGRVRSWVKCRNPKAPAAMRIDDGTF